MIHLAGGKLNMRKDNNRTNVIRKVGLSEVCGIILFRNNFYEKKTRI